MPTIPQIGEPQVAPGVPPLVKPYAKGPLELGAGLGAGISDLGVSIQREEARERAKANAAAIDNALLSLDTTETDARIAFDKTSGNDAGIAAQPTVAAYEKARQALRSKLTGEQQAEFDRISGQRFNNFRQYVMTRGTDEQGKYYKQTFENGQKVSVARVLDTVERDGVEGLMPPVGPRQEGDTAPQTEQDVAYDRIDSYAAAHDGELGMPKEEWVRQRREDYDSSYTMAVVEGLMQRGDDEGAEAYFQANQGRIKDMPARLALGETTASRGKDARVEAAATDILDQATAAATPKDGSDPDESAINDATRPLLAALPDGDRNAVRDRLRELKGERADEKEAEQRDTFNRLHDALQGGPNDPPVPFKDIEATNDFMVKISPDQRDALRVYSQRLTDGDFSATNSEVMGRLMATFKRNPADLLKVNVRELTSTGQLASSDAREIESLQDKIRKASAGDGAAADGLKLSMTRQQTRDAWAKKLGMGEKASGEFDLRLKEIERREQATLGRELTDAEYDTLVQRQTIKLLVDRPWTWDTEKFVFELNDDEADYLSAHPGWMPYDKIPPADREVIIEELRNGGEDVDEFKVREEYVKFLMRYREASK